jgi:enamine deaminase RidA (YjgF/YER057c/UK114 family)
MLQYFTVRRCCAVAVGVVLTGTLASVAAAVAAATVAAIALVLVSAVAALTTVAASVDKFFTDTSFVASVRKSAVYKTAAVHNVHIINVARHASTSMPITADMVLNTQ